MPPAAAARAVLGHAKLIGALTFLSRIVGLAREVVAGHFLGAGIVANAFTVAFTIPNLFRKLFGEGALSAAFVTTFAQRLTRRGDASAWHLASLVVNTLAIVVGTLTLVGIWLAPAFVHAIAPGFADVPGKAELTVHMTRVMFPFLLLIALAAVAMGVLNTKGVFGIPASASTVFNVASIIFGLGFAYWLSGGGWLGSADKAAIPSPAAQWAIIGMAIGTLIGGASQFLMQVPSLYKVGFRFSPILSFTDEGVRRVMALMTPAILGTSAVQINVLINTYFVSQIDGAQGWLNYAFRLMQFPIGLFGVAVGTASVPVLSRMASEGKLQDFRNTLSSSINLVFLMTLPSACGLVVLGEPIIRLIYEHGKFDAMATSMTALALAGYSIGLTGYAAIKVLSPAFYALNDAKTPMIIAIASIAVNALASFFFREWLSHFGVSDATPHGYGHVGVALATSTVALVNFFALAIFMRKRISRLNGREVFASFARIAAASVVMSVVCWSSYRFLHGLFSGKSLRSDVIEAFVPIIVGGLTFLLAAKLLGVTELERLYNSFARKLRPGK